MISRRKYNKLPIEVRRAAMEGRCANRHSNYAFSLGYVYCPWCGTELKFEMKCARCGKSFNSVNAYAAHLDEEFTARVVHCPAGTSHTVHLRKHRGTIFCDYCQREYPLPPKKLKGTGPKARRDSPMKSGDGVLGLVTGGVAVVERKP